ncbi:unnamed protein product [Brassicogethes aeneus]|uniref:CCHC-type domain-containing protein n=1 Tax=Brassicogethes aeneus TaxID=1431903 RepID=A0A9P0B7V9_BRAAE|nr:unnamed protein product [Brassicogethes aeneus]
MLKMLSDTRWSCRAEATKAIVDGYSEIKEALTSIRSKKRSRELKQRIFWSHFTLQTKSCRTRRCLLMSDFIPVIDQLCVSLTERLHAYDDVRSKFGFLNHLEEMYAANLYAAADELSVIQMTGFRSLGDEEEVEFECQVSDKGLEATKVTGPQSTDCRGSHRRPASKKRFRKIRCYNCGEFANHIAAKCTMGPQPKRCHNCKSSDHLIADCPTRTERTSKSETTEGTENGAGTTPDTTAICEAAPQAKPNE